MTIFDALREDHDRQRRLLNDLVDTSGDSAHRRELLGAVKAELAEHAAAEERAFYVPLMESDLTQEKARHSVAEHHEMDELVETLAATEPSSPAWLAHAKNLRERVNHHLDEEEHEVFQQAGRVLSDKRKSDLGAQHRHERAAMAGDC